MADKIFTNGFIFKTKPNAPEFVKMGVSVKADEAIKFIQDNKNESGWLNFDVKESQGGKIYGELDTWKPDAKKKTTEEVDEDLPF